MKSRLRGQGAYSSLSLYAALKKNLLGTESGLVVASALNGEPESNCNSVLCSKGKFL